MPRSLSTSQAKSKPVPADFACVFETEIGWMIIIGRDHLVQSVSIGHASATAARKSLKQSSPDLKESDWCPELREALQDYAKGKRVHFDQFELQLPDQTLFRDRVLAATRQLGYGQTISYGELARRVGHPRAARAVGTAMSTNRFPILIPCHRVLASGGKLGGYSSHAGVNLKQVLLDLESAG